MQILQSIEAMDVKELTLKAQSHLKAAMKEFHKISIAVEAVEP